MAHQIPVPLSNTEIAAFCSQMAMILKSGISSAEGISLMLEDSTSSDEKALLTIMQDTLTETGCFYQALDACKIFPDYLIQMATLGEQTGKLDDVMSSLSDHYEREASIAQTIKSAVTYPLIMIAMMFLVIVVLLTKVMPIFNQVFKQLGSEMSGFSNALLQLGLGLNRYSIVFIVLLVSLAAFLIFVTKTAKGRRWFGRITTRLAFTRSLSEKIAACRFASGLSLTLSSGMSPSQCLELASALAENDLFCNKLKGCTDAVNQGADLSDALISAGIFTGIYARMITIGTKTGVLDNVMNDISNKYREEIDTRLSGLIGTLEPALVILLSLIVGMILLSVILPLMGVMSGL